ncbi:type II toxin-antitoxin system VapC family toxin [Microbacterium sp. F2]|jgi:toxin-antitoxin system PIN domain toxin|uniref:type II toxin-antitoxin system VapC family toxin n=1 Tax=Microbacterium sp. F2 TaxID=3422228 RepID=UPI003FD076C1
MKLVDANVLLYAVDADARHHTEAKTWLDSALSSRETVAIPWVCALAFVRLSTNSRIYANPLPVDEAFDILNGWMSRPSVISPQPGAGHSDRMRTLLDDVGTGGNLVTDAHLAALAIENRAEIVTFDGDFGRFPGVVSRRPGE